MPGYVTDPHALSPQEKREHVLAYTLARKGTKAQYLQEHGLTVHYVRKWSRQMLSGDLEADLSPRSHERLSKEQAADYARLEIDNAAKDRLIEDLFAELDKRDRTIDALGKAIEAMQGSGVASRENS